MTDRRQLMISAGRSSGVTVMAITGTLDSRTYRQVRDSVIDAAVTGLTTVIVDVSGLEAPAVSAWTAFSSARWHVLTWPDVPIVLVCDNEVGRARIRRSGVTRYVPLHGDRVAAVAAAGDDHRRRRRAQTQFDATPSSMRAARRFTADRLTAWARPDMVLTASTVVTVFVENVLNHTLSRPVVLVETVDDVVTVAVSDSDPRPAVRQENPRSGAHTVSGLAVVTAVSRAWGCSPTAGGKTVWALLGPENRL
ncbi:STAS domain-containing protein [Mycolicibacterium psychrotolerans]|nr:STAS domain-containing protein [Mycolicibacterium psychrotolerans]